MTRLPSSATTTPSGTAKLAEDSSPAGRAIIGYWDLDDSSRSALDHQEPCTVRINCEAVRKVSGLLCENLEPATGPHDPNQTVPGLPLPGVRDIQVAAIVKSRPIRAVDRPMGEPGREQLDSA